MVDRLFHLAERETSARTENRAGAATFMVMACIIFVNPIVLGFAGNPGLEGMGLTSVGVGLLFLLAMWFAQATAPALIIVGFYMMAIALEVPWQDHEEAR
jgi:AGZA family xanthine/uracil permease-like MFS transporter